MAIDIIMYHYVRNNEEQDFDTFNRRINEFCNQIDFFIKDSLILNPLDLDQVNFYLKNKDKNAYLLTFDDGLIDHYFCANFLASRGLNAYFFPPINSIKGNLLDVHAIHILLGKRGINSTLLLNEISIMSNEYNLKFLKDSNEVTFETYLSRSKISNRFDDLNTHLFKRILQRDLIGEKKRRFIIENLLLKFYEKDTKFFAKKIYLSVKQMQKMKSIGMVFGSHGATHRWLNTLNYEEQKSEINDSLIYLKNLNLIKVDEPQAICYPFGAYNEVTLSVIDNLNLNLGFTTYVGRALEKCENTNLFKLPRWDTNDFWDKGTKKANFPKQLY